MAGDDLEKVVAINSAPKPNPEVAQQSETPKTLEQILYEPKLHLPISPTNNTK
jgi:hypothetical protein